MKTCCRWAVFLLFPLFSCSLPGLGTKGEPKPEAKKPEAVAYEEDFDPLTLNDDDVKITPVDRSGAGASTQQRTVVVPKSDKSLNQGEMVQGFRIQLLATSSLNQATETKKNAMVKLQGKIYLDHDGAQYKIRLGDFSSSDEANSALEGVRKNGYPDAWIVKCQVYKAAAEERGE
jgi:hypothetical protein